MSALTHVSAGAGEETPTPQPQADHKSRNWMPYLLLLPGALWLLVFFVVPLIQLFTVSLQSQFPGYPGFYYRDVNLGNYAIALTDFAPQFFRSFALRRPGHLLRVLPGLPAGLRDGLQGGALAQRHAHRGDRAVLHLVHPAHRGLAADPLRRGPGRLDAQLPPPAPGRSDHRDLGRGRGRPHLQLPAVHGAADLRLARAGRPARHRGRRRPVRQRVHHLPHRHAADQHARRARRHPADLHPGGR